MPHVQTDNYKLVVRHSPVHLGKLQLFIDGAMVAALDRNDAMVLADLLNQVAYELPVRP